MTHTTRHLSRSAAALAPLLMAAIAAASGPVNLDLDPQRLGGDLLLVSMATEGPLLALAEPARAVFDFIAAAPEGGTPRVRIQDDRGWLQWRVDGAPAGQVRLMPGLGRLIGRIAALTEREEAAQTTPVETGDLLAVASSYGFDRTGLLQALAASDLPAGRLAGRWHSHPGYPGGEPPSADDSEVAAAHGRFLTIRFRTDGYDI